MIVFNLVNVKRRNPSIVSKPCDLLITPHGFFLY